MTDTEEKAQFDALGFVIKRSLFTAEEMATFSG